MHGKTILNRTRGQFYLKCKKEWGEADYLNENGSKRGRIWKTRMRTSSVPLKAILKSDHLSTTDQCSLCSNGAKEDQQHMLLQCKAYEEERKVMLEQVVREKAVERTVDHWNDSDAVTAFYYLILPSECEDHFILRGFQENSTSLHQDFLLWS